MTSASDPKRTLRWWVLPMLVGWYLTALAPLPGARASGPDSLQATIELTVHLSSDGSRAVPQPTLILEFRDGEVSSARVLPRPGALPHQVTRWSKSLASLPGRSLTPPPLPSTEEPGDLRGRLALDLVRLVVPQLGHDEDDQSPLSQHVALAGLVVLQTIFVGGPEGGRTVTWSASPLVLEAESGAGQVEVTALSAEGSIEVEEATADRRVARLALRGEASVRRRGSVKAYGFEASVRVESRPPP